jgi:adenylate cyclase
VKAGTAAAAVLALAALLAPGAAAPPREAATDALMRLVPRPGEPSAPVVAVAVDEAALAALGPWPWPREALAALVSAVAAAGAAAVALDVVLDEPAEGDAALAAAMRAAPAVQAALAGRAATSGFGVAVLGAPDLSRLPALPGLAPSAIAGVPAGFAGLPGDVVRAAPMLVRLGTDGALAPGLATAALARGLGETALLLRAGAPMLLQAGPAGLDLPPDGLLRLHPASMGVPVLPAGVLLAGALGPEALRGRLAVIGVTAPGAAALRPSVFGSFTPSLILQAEAAAQLAQGWVPRRPMGGAATEALAALLLGAAAAALVRRWAGTGLALAGLLALGWACVAAAALRLGPLLLDPMLPAAAALLAGAAESAAAALRLARERTRLLARFASRLPTGVADRLLALPAADRLRPERCRVAVVMTDLAGFSAMVNRAEPGALVAALNAYLAGIEAAMLAEGATLERLIGDSVLGVFGAPLAQPDHAARAIAAARAVDRFAEAFRTTPEAMALGWGETRIGVAAGEVLAGEIGGSRLTWAVCGDAANMAARLQELGKQLGRRALVAAIEDPSLPPPLGRFTLRGLPGEWEVRPLSAQP